MAEHIYYYRLRKLRQAACTALQQSQTLRLTEFSFAPKQEGVYAKLRLTTKAGTLEILEAARSVLDQVLRTMLHVE